MDFDTRFRGNPEEWNGLLVYPVRMRDYAAFLTAQESITASQQAFPYPFSTMRYLEALYCMKGMFSRLCLMLALVFQLPLEGVGLSVIPRLNGDKLLGLRIIQGGRGEEITPKNFGELRKLIAWQNGLELPDETQNTELAEAQKDIQRKDAVPLKADMESLIYSVSLKAKTDPLEVMDWTVRRFRATERALDRSVGHLIASVTLAAGGKFKGGNPYPSWKYDREEQNQGVELLSALTGRLSGAVENRGINTV